MRVYITDYVNGKDINTDNAFFVLTDQERKYIKASYLDMQEKYQRRLAKGTLKRWNKYDHQAMQFIVTLFMYEDGGGMIDPTVDQLNFIDKTLRKLYKGDNTDFFNWANLEFTDATPLTREQSFKNMERKRQLKKKWENAPDVTEKWADCFE